MEEKVDEIKTESKLEPQDPDIDVDVTAEEPAIVAYIDEDGKRSWLLFQALNQGDYMEIKNSQDVEVNKDTMVCQIVGKLDPDKSTMLEGDPPRVPSRMIRELLPYMKTKLTTRAEQGLEDIILSDLPCVLVDFMDTDLGTAMYGQIIPAQQVKETMAVIAYVNKTHEGIILSTDEDNMTERKPLLFENRKDAEACLNTLRKYPDFTDNAFYKQAAVLTLDEIGEYKDQEHYVYFDIWMKACANLSAHMRKE